MEERIANLVLEESPRAPALLEREALLAEIETLVPLASKGHGSMVLIAGEPGAGTADYAADLDAAVEDGFFIITQMIPDMGYHFLNPNVEDFDIGQPPILVYSRAGDDWELGAVEWVFPEEPAEPRMEGATYGAFPAACHFDDGLFVPTAGDGCRTRTGCTTAPTH